MKGKGVLAALRRYPWVGPLVALVVVYALFGAARPDTMLRAVNVVTMLRQTAIVGIAATGATIVIVAGGIDLSVGSAVALTTVVVAYALRSGQGPVAAAVAGIVVAVLTGVVNGVATAGLDITPFIVTLGTMSILRGAAKGLAHEQKIDADPRGLDAIALPSHGLLGLPIAVWAMFAVAAVAAFGIRSTRFGRRVVAIGSNERTARLCGVRVGPTKVAVYALAGLCTGIAGVIGFAKLTVGDPTGSIGLELDVIASAVIGGGSLSGGEGSVLGTLFGAMLMTVIRTGCTHLGLSNWVQEVATGCIIVAAVTLDRLRRR
ncbi:MAG TPA: ABC transporter permease [Minicystis sp.]|nr:ABC transporter permease [Minicystis sp.]